MCAIPHVPCQVPGNWWVLALVLIITLLFQINTNSVITPAGTFWLFALSPLALYKYASNGAVVPSILLGVLHCCAIVLYGITSHPWLQRVSHKLLHVLFSLFAKAGADFRKITDFTLDLFFSTLNPTYCAKSRSESRDEEGILTPGECISLPQSREPSALGTESSSASSPSLAPRPTRTLHSDAPGTSDLAPSADDANDANTTPTRPTPSSESPSNTPCRSDSGLHSTFASGSGHPSKPAVGSRVSSALLSSPGASTVDGGSTGQAGPGLWASAVVALPKGSRKLPKTNLSTDNADNRRGRIVAATAGGRPASLSLPHILSPKDFVDSSFLSHVRRFSVPTLVSSPSSASTPLTPTPTSTCSIPVYLQTNLERATSAALKPAPSNFPEVQLPANHGENTSRTAPSLVELKETQTREHRRANSGALLPNSDLSQSKYNSQRVKRQGRYFGKGRKIWSFLVPTAPLSLPAPRALGVRALEPDQHGSSQAEVVQEISIPMRSVVGPAGIRGASDQIPTALPPSTPTTPPVLAGCARKDDKYIDDNGISQDGLVRDIITWMKLPIGMLGPVVVDDNEPASDRELFAPIPPSVVVFEVGASKLDKPGQATIAEQKKEPAVPASGSAEELASAHTRIQPLRLSVSATPTLAETNREGDGAVARRFSTPARRETTAESWRAATHSSTRLLDKASIGGMRNQTLSQRERDMLERSGARPPSAKNVVHGVASPWWLQPPSPPLVEPTPGQVKQLPPFKKLIKKIIPHNPFKHRSRAGV
ncbi:hypothetical protein FRC01_003928 [Tulasnella sp. 417]|nr:hypothetical protein FRC01_003928 [Tulasnella sp. 417]